MVIKTKKPITELPGNVALTPKLKRLRNRDYVKFIKEYQKEMLPYELANKPDIYINKPETSAKKRGKVVKKILPNNVKK